VTEENKNQELAYCPNCSGPAIRNGKLIVCQTCNASFRFTQEGPKVDELGPLDQLKGRVSKIEERLAGIDQSYTEAQNQDGKAEGDEEVEDNDL